MLTGAQPSAVPGSRPLRLRLVRQMEVGDCGAACLATVLRAHGRRADLAALRDLSSTGRDGVSAAGLLAAARRHGFTGVGVRCPADALDQLPPGAVLHWSNHFVVLTGRSRRGLHVLDPALGRRVVPAGTVREQYSGVALLFTPDGPADAAVDAEPPAPPRLRRYRPFVAGTGRAALLALLLAAVVQAFAVVFPLVLREVVQAAQGGASATTGLALGVAALAVGFAAAQVGRLLALVALQRVVDVRVTAGVLHHLARLPYTFLARRSVGDLALRVRSTVAVRQVLTSSALSTVLDGLLVLGYLAVLLALDARFALLTAAAVAVQVVVVAVAWPRLRQAAAEALEAQTTSQAGLLELVSGLQLLKATGSAPGAVDRWSPRLEREVAATARSARASGLVDSVLAALRFAAPPLLLVLALARVQSGELALADALALAALAAAVTVPVGALLTAVCALSAVLSYLERLDDLLQAEPEPTGGRPPPARLRGRVELREVSFRYSALLPPALGQVSAVLEPGSHVAVVGSSASGKTTLALLVATLYEPTSGALLLDGVDAREYDRDALRRRIGLVTQDVTLFAGTVRENVVHGRPQVSARDVERACRTAALHDELVALPSGYDTVLGNGGAGLSGGQRQRLALARALAARPGLLVLDEATSALDPVTERAVHAALARLAVTRLVVAHRLTTVTSADRVLVLEQGRLVGDGTYAGLRRRSRHLRALLEADGRLRPR